MAVGCGVFARGIPIVLEKEKHRGPRQSPPSTRHNPHCSAACSAPQPLPYLVVPHAACRPGPASAVHAMAQPTSASSCRLPPPMKALRGGTWTGWALICACAVICAFLSNTAPPASPRAEGACTAALGIPLRWILVTLPYSFADFVREAHSALDRHHRHYVALSRRTPERSGSGARASVSRVRAGTGTDTTPSVGVGDGQRTGPLPAKRPPSVSSSGGRHPGEHVQTVTHASAEVLVLPACR